MVNKSEQKNAKHCEIEITKGVIVLPQFKQKHGIFCFMRSHNNHEMMMQTNKKKMGWKIVEDVAST